MALVFFSLKQRFSRYTICKVDKLLGTHNTPNTVLAVMLGRNSVWRRRAVRVKTKSRGQSKFHFTMSKSDREGVRSDRQ